MMKITSTLRGYTEMVNEMTDEEWEKEYAKTCREMREKITIADHRTLADHLARAEYHLTRIKFMTGDRLGRSSKSYKAVHRAVAVLQNDIANHLDDELADECHRVGEDFLTINVSYYGGYTEQDMAKEGFVDE